MRLVVACVLLAGCHLELFPGHDGNDDYGDYPDEPRPDAAHPDETAPDAPPMIETKPILHYPFDGSLANDGSLGHAFDGTGTAYTFTAGKLGTAVKFDTTRNTQVLLPTQVPMSNHDAYTIGFWFREDVVWNSDPYTQYLFNNRGAGGFQTYHGASGSQALTTCSAAGCQAFGYSVGAWHHLAYRFAGVSGTAAPLEIFIDGKLVTKLPASTIYFDDTQTSITLGTRTNMQIDDLRVYARALTVDELCTAMIGGTFDGTTCADSRQP